MRKFATRPLWRWPMRTPATSGPRRFSRKSWIAALSYEAIEALQNMGSNAKTPSRLWRACWPVITDRLMCVWRGARAGQDRWNRACAPLAQAIVGSKNDQARGWITDAVDSINRVRVGAANAIVEITPACPQTIPILIATLANPGRQPALLRNSAVLRYRRWRQRQKDPNLSVREDAVQTLAAIRPVSPAAVRALTLALRRREPRPRLAESGRRCACGHQTAHAGRG